MGRFGRKMKRAAANRPLGSQRGLGGSWILVEEAVPEGTKDTIQVLQKPGKEGFYWHIDGVVDIGVDLEGFEFRSGVAYSTKEEALEAGWARYRQEIEEVTNDLLGDVED